MFSVGIKVTVIDQNRDRINNLGPFVDDALLLENATGFIKLKNISFQDYDAFILIAVQTELDFFLPVLNVLKTMDIKNLHICVETENQQKMAELFTDVPIFRIDGHLAELFTTKLLTSLS